MLQDIYSKAIIFAAKAHRGQSIPGSEIPYIVHCARVCCEAVSATEERTDLYHELLINCALLHDTLEDTAILYNDILSEFGEDTAKGVLALTKNKSIETSLRMQDSLLRIGKMTPEIAIVKMSDRITNLDPPPAHWDNEKISAYLEESEIIFLHLEGSDKRTAKRLMDKIINYRKFVSR